DIHDALWKLFKATQKCNAIRQLALWIKQHWLDFNKSLMLTWTPLHIIAQKGLSNIYKRFGSSDECTKEVEFGALDSLDDQNETPLHLATSQGHLKMVALLLDKGADAAAQDNEGRTALYGAAWKGHKDVVMLLLDKGADAATQDYEGR